MLARAQKNAAAQLKIEEQIIKTERTKAGDNTELMIKQEDDYSCEGNNALGDSNVMRGELLNVVREDELPICVTAKNAPKTPQQ